MIYSRLKKNRQLSRFDISQILEIKKRVCCFTFRHDSVLKIQLEKNNESELF